MHILTERSLYAILQVLAIGETVTGAKFKFCKLKSKIVATKEALVFFGFYFIKVSILK